MLRAVKRLRILLLLALLAAVGAMLWTAHRRARARTFVLPDGNRLTFHAVTIGSNVPMNFGSAFERVMSRLPGSWGAKHRLNSWTEESQREAVVFWFLYDRPPPSNSYVDMQFVGALAGRAHAFFSLPAQTLPNGKVITSCGSHLWPRRARQFTIRVIHHQGGAEDKEVKEGEGQDADTVALMEKEDNDVPVGELTVANPDFRAYPEWAPEALPATRRVDGVEFRLVEMNTVSLMATTALRVTREGRPDAEWEACSYQVRDATGNWAQFQPSSLAYTPRAPRALADSNGVVTLGLGFLAWPAERAWKLGVEFVRTQRLESNEVFVLRGVPARAAGTRTSDTWRTNTPAGLIELRHEPDWQAPKSPLSLFTFEPERSDYADASRNPLRVLLLEAVNDRGEKLPVFEQRKIHILPGSLTVDITVAAPKRCWVEYLVDPGILPTPR